LLKEAEFIRKSIRSLNRSFEQSIQKKVEQSGVTVPQMQVITEVVSHQGISIKELAQNLQMTQSTVSGVVERLINKGILVKKSNPQDKRFVEIYHTYIVSQFLENDRMEYANQFVVDALCCLQPNQREIVMEGLHLLLSAVEKRSMTEMKGEK
jgi:MarR family transcriptional regulator, organic hydroperoxide resistance regulator